MLERAYSRTCTSLIFHNIEQTRIPTGRLVSGLSFFWPCLIFGIVHALLTSSVGPALHAAIHVFG